MFSVPLSPLSCEHSEYYHYRQAWIPLRWLPTESVFEDEYSTKSDVWAFGVLMWEVFSLGEMPHSKLSDDEVLEGRLILFLRVFLVLPVLTRQISPRNLVVMFVMFYFQV